MNGLSPQTSEIFEDISKLECIKPFFMVGGTALSLQLKTRLSEDLDFMRWKQGPKDKLEVGWPVIERELESLGKVEHDVYGLDQVIFKVRGVKLSFYAAPRKQLPSMQPIVYKNNLRIADIRTIGALKMEVMLRRAKFRDYYDLYSILKSGVKIEELIPLALEHSGHKLKSKNLLSMITNGEFYKKDKDFLNLNPIYDVSAYDIQEYIKERLLEIKGK
ncbi:MAG: nucleotidyl transferase AbiEii/AbiGii toxin family protein [Prevotella sp.]|nr:nucleotidyl transferase AbiEii/AbiGii toxin family protein [Prevotella sp.]